MRSSAAMSGCQSCQEGGVSTSPAHLLCLATPYLTNLPRHKRNIVALGSWQIAKKCFLLTSVYLSIVINTKTPIFEVTYLQSKRKYIINFTL